MKNTLYYYLNKPYAVVIVMVLAPFLSLIDRNFSYFFGLFIALFLLWADGFNWQRFGFGTRLNLKTIVHALLLAIAIFVIIDIFIQPFLEIYFGRIDLSSVDDIRGDVASFVILMIIMWVFAAFGEEFLFCGYYQKHLAELLGNTDKSWLISALVLSLYFGVSHGYQGLAGIIAVGLASTIFFIGFSFNRQNLLLLVFAHGFYDTIGLTLIHLDKDSTFYDLAIKLITNGAVN